MFNGLAKLAALDPEGSNFTNRQPAIRAVDSEWREFVLLEDVCYDVGKPNSGDRIVVKKGFVTDFASTPKVLWGVYPPLGKYSASAIIHDFLLKEGKRTRHEADRIFYESMGVLGIGKVQRYTLYAGVRLGTLGSWLRKKLF